MPLPTLVTLHAGLILLGAWLVTQGSWSWWEEEMLGRAYDSLARHLLEGNALVDADAIQFEAWKVDGRTHMYFGPWPALVRMVPLWLFPSLAGRFARSSVMLAMVGALWAWSLLLRAALAHGSRTPERVRQQVFMAGMVVVLAASPITVVASCASIYHEAICWGFFSATWGLLCAYRILSSPQPSAAHVAGLAAAAGAGLLSRVTFGLPLYGILVVLAGQALWRERRVWPWWLAAMLPALAAGVMQLWYNHARFGSPLEAAPFAFYTASRPEGLPEAFHWKRMPSGLWAYVAAHAQNFSTRAPWLRYAEIPALQPEYFHKRTTPLLSIFLGAPWLLLALVGGLASVWRDPRRRVLMACVVSLLVQVLLLLGYYWHGYRYAADFLPLFLFLLVLCAEQVTPGQARVFQATALVGVVASSLSSLHFHSIWWTYRREHQEAAKAVLRWLDGLFGVTG